MVVEGSIEEAAKNMAREWRAYVLDPSTWDETSWEKALGQGLAVRRVKVKQDADGNKVSETHLYVLTDKGLDLMNEGK